MGYVLGNKSRRRLYGVHPDLILVVNKAIEITTQDFTVLEGLRTLERQQQLYNTGKSKTMNSRHLTGHAVDLAPWPISWDWEYFYPIAEAMKDASDEVGVPIEWGGDWQSFPDGPHFQLPWKEYPA